VNDDGEDQWAASLLFDRAASVCPPPMTGSNEEESGYFASKRADTGDPDEANQPKPVDLDPSTDSGHDTGSDVADINAVSDVAAVNAGSDVADTNAGAKKTAMMLGAALVAAVVVIVGVMVAFRRPDPAAPPNPLPPSPTARASATSTAAQPPTDTDEAVPFTASANCPAGSTSAQALTDTASDSAWVCVRGAPGGQVDGQVLHVDLGRSYLLAAVSVTPGWVAKTPGGKDEWLAHRVVTRLQYVFNDDDRTTLTQDTANTHGPVTTPLPHRVLASRVTVIVLQTSRPPTSPLRGVDPTAATQPGFIDSVLGNVNGPVGADASQTSAPASDPTGQDRGDPVDATFAVAAMKFLGHRPN
jgi:hypothetical protein